VCARFTFFTHVSTEERKVFVLYSTIEALWKRDGLRIENERKQAEEKKRALTACLARLEKRLRQSS
jgi:transposase InsO family protein